MRKIKLWKKIGLQKDLIQGTSHSQKSKQSIINNLQQNSKQNSFEINQQSIVTQVSNSHKSDNSVISPIDKLQFQSFQNKVIRWSKEHQLNSHKNNQYKAFALRQDIIAIQNNNDHFLNGQCQSVFNGQSEIIILVNSQQYKLDQFQQIYTKIQQNQQQQQTILNHYFIQEVHCEQMFTMTIKQYESLLSEVQLCSGLRLEKLPFMQSMIKSLKQEQLQEKIIIQQQLLALKAYIFRVLNDQISEKFHQYISQIGYLYGQNKQLLQKIKLFQIKIKQNQTKNQQNMLLIRNLQEQNKNLYEQNKNMCGKDSRIQKRQRELLQIQQNQINKLYQKMQDYSQIEYKNQLLLQNINSLQNDLKLQRQSNISNRLKSNQFVQQISLLKLSIQNSQQKINYLNKQINYLKKQINHLKKQIQIANLKVQNLGDQISQACIKHEQTEYKLSIKYQSQLKQKQTQFNQQISLLNHHLLNKQLQTKKNFQQLNLFLKQFVKYLDQDQVYNALKNVTLPKNGFTNQLATKITQFNLSQKNINANDLSNDTISIKSQTNQQKSYKNLINTGYFGQQNQKLIKNQYKSNFIQYKPKYRFHNRNQTTQIQSIKYRTKTQSFITDRDFQRDNRNFQRDNKNLFIRNNEQIPHQNYSFSQLDIGRSMCQNAYQTPSFKKQSNQTNPPLPIQAPNKYSNQNQYKQDLVQKIKQRLKNKFKPKQVLVKELNPTYKKQFNKEQLQMNPQNMINSIMFKYQDQYATKAGDLNMGYSLTSRNHHPNVFNHSGRSNSRNRSKSPISSSIQQKNRNKTGNLSTYIKYQKPIGVFNNIKPRQIPVNNTSMKINSQKPKINPLGSFSHKIDYHNEYGKKY